MLAITINKKMRIKYLTILFLLVSCRSVVEDSFSAASSCMLEHPDSALAIIRSIAPDDLKRKGEKAHYSLLLATALDRNHIDTTDTHLLDPALYYYSHWGSRDERAATWYYLGKIQLHAGQAQNARESFSTALDYSEGSSDNLLLLRLYAQVSALYSKDNNLDEAWNYIRMARNAAAKTSDTRNIRLLQAREATSLSNLGRYREADSLFADYFAQPVIDSSVWARFLLNYSKTLLRKTPSAPEESIKSYEKAVAVGSKPNLDNACVYALSCELCDRSKDADRILLQLDATNPQGRNVGILKLCKYRIYKLRGDTEKALKYYEEAIAVSDSIVQQTLRQSLERSRQEYMAKKAEAAELKRKNSMVVASLLLLFMLLSGWALYWKRRNKLKAKEEELEALREDTSRLLAQEKGKDDTISRLRGGYVSMYKRQFKLLDDLCAAYWSPSRTDTKDRIYSKVRSALNVIEGDAEGQRKLEAMIDRDLDGIMTKLRSDFPGRTDEEFRFIAYLIIGLSPKTIACIQNCAPGSVYNRKMRLKERLSNLNSPWRDQYLEYII